MIRTRSLLFILMFGGLCFVQPLTAQPDARFYELRIYETGEGQLDLLLHRFRAHTNQLFTRHGIRTHGHWIPVDQPNKLYYIVSYEQRSDREGAFAGFLEDPDWITISGESKEAGLNLKGIESTYLELTDYSPSFDWNFSVEPRFFELRIYTANAGKLADLHNRFRNHTVSIFEKLGMHNVGYWKLTDADQGAEDKLLYLLAYPDKDSRDAAWTAFRADKEWIAAKAKSVENGTLVANVESIFMHPTDYSPIR